MQKKCKEFVGVRFDADVMAWLKRASRNSRVTVSHLIRQAVQEKFDSRRK